MIRDPNKDPVALSEQAETALARDDLESAETLATRALALDPLLVSAKVVLGFAAAQTGRPELAIECLQEAVSLDKTLWGPRTALAYLLRTVGKPIDAIQVWKEALPLNPEDAQGWFELGRCFFDLGQFADAGAMFGRAIRIDAEAAAFHAFEGQCLEKLGQPRKAVQSYAEAVRLDPNEPVASLRLSELSPIVERPGTDSSPKADAATAEGLFWLGKLQFEAGDMRSAENTYRLSLDRDPDAPEVMAQYALMLIQAGRFEESTELLWKAIRVNPNWTQPYAILTMSRKVTGENADLVGRMEALSKTDLEPEQHSALLRTLGKAYSDLGEPEKAMGFFDEGHLILESELHRRGQAFDQAKYKASVDEMIERFTPADVAKWSAKGFGGDAAVCIIGMIRSGTTLTEQVLTSHSEIGGAGELLYWFHKLREYKARYLESGSEPPLRNWGENYQKFMEVLCPGKLRITDKQPENYFSAPLIHSCSPHARFIHCRRNPIDTCISIYTTPGISGPKWQHTRENIVFVYRQYLRMIESWKQVLPQDAMLEVDYEATVGDREAVIRQMIDFLGLSWDPNCLHHEDNPAAIITPSSWQARQPIYSSSVERWRKYENVLGAFEILRDE